jgi:hypothetical protein
MTRCVVLVDPDASPKSPVLETARSMPQSRYKSFINSICLKGGSRYGIRYNVMGMLIVGCSEARERTMAIVYFALNVKVP